MRQMRFRATMLAGWLILFYTVERLIDPVDITTVGYAMVLIVALFTLLIPRWSRMPLWVIVTIPILTFLAVKAWTGVDVLGTAALLTVAEACAIVVTIFLARWLSLAMTEFEDAIAHITIGRRDQVAEPSSIGQNLIYREVRRARSHDRPLTLMAMEVEEDSIHAALERIVQEAQFAMIKQYALSAVSKVLCDELEDCDILVQSDSHFLIALPETTPDRLPGLRERLRALVSDRTGVSLSIGAASLPQDALTFEGLMDKAIKEMKGDHARRPLSRPTRTPTEHYTA